jgi:hypothetical protein
MNGIDTPIAGRCDYQLSVRMKRNMAGRLAWNVSVKTQESWPSVGDTQEAPKVQSCEVGPGLFPGRVESLRSFSALTRKGFQ